jgi:hypothetical protein
MGKEKYIGDDGKCICCHGKQRLVTDMWNKETMATWEPCPFCCEEEAKTFYSDGTVEAQRQAWYTKGGKHTQYTMTADQRAVT